MILPAAPTEVKPATLSHVLTDDEFRDWAGRKLVEIDADEPRPTAGPDFLPSPEDRAEAVAILNASTTDYWPTGWPHLLEVSTVSDWDYRSELAYEAERIAAGPVL